MIQGRIARTDGQTLTESVLLMPLFLLFVFFLFQVGHVGIGIGIVNYAASSIAKQAVQENAFNQSEATSKLNDLLMAGLKPQTVTGTAVSDPVNVTTNLLVVACAELPAYPFVGPFLKKAIRSNKKPADAACSGAEKWIGPVGLSATSPYHFIIQGQAMVRMNYNSKGQG